MQLKRWETIKIDNHTSYMQNLMLEKIKRITFSEPDLERGTYTVGHRDCIHAFENPSQTLPASGKASPVSTLQAYYRSKGIRDFVSVLKDGGGAESSTVIPNFSNTKGL